jgi:hypothetical protein
MNYVPPPIYYTNSIRLLFNVIKFSTIVEITVEIITVYLAVRSCTHKRRDLETFGGKFRKDL